MGRFTDREIDIAKSVDLTAIAAQLGYTVKKVGRHFTLKEMDSVVIYDRKTWCRWSRIHQCGENGGSQIDFLKAFAGMDFKDAVTWLLDFSGYDRYGENSQVILKDSDIQKQEEKLFALPERNGDNNRLYQYLMNERGISKTVIEHFVRKNILYEMKYRHNAVFVGRDKQGTAKYAHMKGTNAMYPFKCDVGGNDKNYGFNSWNEKSDKLYVFEAAVDLMSFVDIHDDFESNMLALGMLHDAPLHTFLGENPHIHEIVFSLDNDERAKQEVSKLLTKYQDLGYKVSVGVLPAAFKDYNEWLVSLKKETMRNYSADKKSR